jgi:hypothetical protein
VSNNLHWEVWTRPGDANFRKLIADVPFVNASYHEGLGQIGDGSLSLPADFDTTVLADPSIPSGSLLRLMHPSGMIGEWLLTGLTPTVDADDPTTEAQGVGVNSLLAYARLEPYDWDGSDDFTPTFPDWIWGGQNQLSNPGFENSVQTSTIYELVITATSGTFTLSDGTDTTAPISWNASAATIETRLETDIAAISDVLVTPTADGFQIEFVNPPFDINLTVDPSSLGGGTATLAITFFGSYQPLPWMKSQQVSFGTAREFGLYDNFRVVGPSTSPSGPVRTGNFSLWINPGPVTGSASQFAGAQQIVRVNPGGTYQAGVWVYSVSGGDYRLVIRGIDEDLIAMVNATVPAATWTLVSMTDVVMETVNGYQPDQVIFRFANTDPSGTPSDFYLDDAYLDEGLAPTTIGEILRLIYEDATTEHAGRVVWEDQANPPNPYLVLDFSDTHDSHGQPWDRSDLRIRFPMRMSYSQIMAEVARQFGYEYRVIRNPAQDGQWLWQVFNPGTMGQDLSADPSVVVMAGTTETARRTGIRLPAATNMMVEGSERVTARDEDAGLVAALGRIEGAVYRPDAEDVPAAADQTMDDAAQVQENYTVTLVSPEVVPLVDYRVGDLVRVVDPPIDQALRVVDIVLASSAQREEWVVQFGVVLLTGQAAMAQAVAAMIPANPIQRPAGAFLRADPAQQSAASLLLGGGGGAPTVVVAAADATEASKSKADFICTGTHDQNTINQAISTLSNGGRVLLTEGTYNVTDSVFGGSGVGSGRVALQGLGRATVITGATTGPIVDNFYTVSDLDIQQTGSGYCIGVSPDRTATRLRLSSSGVTAAEVSGILSDTFVVGSAHPAVVLGVTFGFGPSAIPGLRNVTTLEGGILVVADLTQDARPAAFIADCRAYQAPYGLEVSQVNNALRHLQLVVSGFVADQCTQGIRIIDTGGVTINGFSLNRTAQHGVYLEDAWATNLQGTIYNSSLQSNNTYDSVHVTGDSHRNRIQVTTMEGGFTTFPRYNVFFDTNTADNIESSDLRSTTGTAAYQDSGTGNTTTDEHFV